MNLFVVDPDLHNPIFVVARGSVEATAIWIARELAAGRKVDDVGIGCCEADLELGLAAMLACGMTGVATFGEDGWVVEPPG